MSNILFQDETAWVEQKAKRAKAKAIAKREQEDFDNRLAKAVVRIQDTIRAPLMYPLIDRGIGFFMSNYALGIEQSPIQPEAYHQHISTHGFHPIIATCMTALGLAGIANICRDFNYKGEAMRSYFKALRMTNNALAISSEVNSDSALLATMMLSILEATNNDRSLSGWSDHIQGSASMLRMRGTEQFATPAGRRMYMQTVALLAMTCLAKGEGLPKYIHEMDRECAKWGEITDLQEIIDKAFELDLIAQSVFDNLDEGRSYDIVPLAGNIPIPGVFGDHYHIYAHIAGAQIWNWVHYNRIYLHDIIRNSLLAGLATSPPFFIDAKSWRLLEDSTQTLYQMQADILASAPQHLYDTPKAPLPYMNDYTESHPSLIDSYTAPSLPTKFFWSNFREKGPLNMLTTIATAKHRLPIVRVSGGYSSV